MTKTTLPALKKHLFNLSRFGEHIARFAQIETINGQIVQKVSFTDWQIVVNPRTGSINVERDGKLTTKKDEAETLTAVATYFESDFK